MTKEQLRGLDREVAVLLGWRWAVYLSFGQEIAVFVPPYIVKAEIGGGDALRICAGPDSPPLRVANDDACPLFSSDWRAHGRLVEEIEGLGVAWGGHKVDQPEGRYLYWVRRVGAGDGWGDTVPQAFAAAAVAGLKLDPLPTHATAGIRGQRDRIRHDPLSALDRAMGVPIPEYNPGGISELLAGEGPEPVEVTP